MTKLEILKAVCKYYQISEKDLLTRSRKIKFILRKQIFTYLLCKDSEGIFANIQEFLGFYIKDNYNHTTLINSRDKIEAQRKLYPEIQTQIDEIRKLYPDCKTQYQTSTGKGCFVYSITK